MKHEYCIRQMMKEWDYQTSTLLSDCLHYSNFCHTSVCVNEWFIPERKQVVIDFAFKTLAFPHVIVSLQSYFFGWSISFGAMTVHQLFSCSACRYIIYNFFLFFFFPLLSQLHVLLLARWKASQQVGKERQRCLLVFINSTLPLLLSLAPFDLSPRS